MRDAEPKLLLVGPLPPPLNGMTVMTSYVLQAIMRTGRPVVHVNTSDHRPVGNVGRLDLQNMILAVHHAFRLLQLSRGPGEFVLYLPIAQGVLGFLRDSLFFEVARFRGIPVVVHLHGAAFGDFYASANRPMKWLIRRCMKTVQHAFVLSESLRHVFVGLMPEERVSVVMNGIPHPLVRREMGGRTPNSRLRVLYLSNLGEGKGHLDLLEAARIVLERRNDVEFIISGEWPNTRAQERSASYVRRWGMMERVRFVSSPSGLRKCQLFHSADVFVFPPRQAEGQPVVLLEAMSCALPIIATPRGGIVDVVHEGVNGFLVPPAQPDKIAMAVALLVEDAGLRRRMGHESRRIYEANHSIEGMATSLDAALGSIVAVLPRRAA